MDKTILTICSSRTFSVDIREKPHWRRSCTKVTKVMILNGYLEPASAKLVVCSVNQAQDYSCA